MPLDIQTDIHTSAQIPTNNGSMGNKVGVLHYL